MKHTKLTNALVLAACLAVPSLAHATPISQFADSVIDVSSQWSTTAWSAAQATGASDTFSYGDIATSWATGPVNGGIHNITLGFAMPTHSIGAVIRETYGNGFVTQIDALDTADILHTVWNSIDASAAGLPVDFTVSWSQTAFLTKGLKIFIDTEHNQSTWEEIDSVQLLSAATSVPEPSSLLLLGLALAGVVTSRSRKSAMV